MPFIYVEKPTTQAGLQTLLETIEKTNRAPHHQEKLYRPLKPYFSSLLPYQVDISEIMQANARMKSDIEGFLAKTQTTLQEHIYFPLYSKYQNIILIFDHNGNLENYVMVPLRER